MKNVRYGAWFGCGNFRSYGLSRIADRIADFYALEPHKRHDVTSFSALDRHSAENVASLLLDLHEQRQTILIVVTHSAELAAKFPARYELIERRLEQKA